MIINYKKGQLSPLHKGILLISGVFSGLINGIMGSGAGIVIVLLLSQLLNAEQSKSQATAMLLVLPLALVSAVVYLFSGQLELVQTLIVVVGVAVGGTIGATLLSKFANDTSRLIFALLLVFGGVKMLVGAL